MWSYLDLGKTYTDINSIKKLPKEIKGKTITVTGEVRYILSEKHCLKLKVPIL